MLVASIFECYVRFYVALQQAERPAAENPASIKMVLLYYDGCSKRERILCFTRKGCCQKQEWLRIWYFNDMLRMIERRSAVEAFWSGWKDCFKHTELSLYCVLVCYTWTSSDTCWENSPDTCDHVNFWWVQTRKLKA